VFEDHVFMPAFWEVTNVVNPIAGICSTTSPRAKYPASWPAAKVQKIRHQSAARPWAGHRLCGQSALDDGCFERQIMHRQPGGRLRI
jgi:hypothetical protein